MKMKLWRFGERVRKNISFYAIVLSAILMRFIHQGVLFVGQWVKALGKRLVEWGAVETPRFTSEILRDIYMVDAEIHMNGCVFRGPLYAMYRQLIFGKALVLSMNWVAKRAEFGDTWTYSGWCSFRLSGFGSPHFIKKDGKDNRGAGNLWFFFDGGYAIIYLSSPRERLLFKGSEETPRVYSYY
jgi:hypothetical protein